MEHRDQAQHYQSLAASAAGGGGAGRAGAIAGARRGSRREGLLELIRQSDGLSRGEILERMGLKGDKAGEMSVSNALTALTKRNQVRREAANTIRARLIRVRPSCRLV